MKAPGGAAAPSAPAPSILTQEFRDGLLPEGGGLSEPAGWGAPGAALQGEGGPQEGACVPGEEGDGRLRCAVEELLGQPERVPGQSEDTEQQFTSILIRVNLK